MFNTHKKKEQATAGQAAVELAVFGAVLIFLLGTIIRSAVGNSYTQNQNFKAMRMALLSSWQDSEAAKGLGAIANTSHNSASVLFVEDRLSPDINKYGDLDRNPYVAQGSGSFSYELLYPTDASDLANPSDWPIMDIYINGQHFPLTTAKYTTNTITRNTGCLSDCQATTPQQQQCIANQAARNSREWVGGTVTASQFEEVFINSVPLSASAGTTLQNDANTVLNDLATVGLITLVNGSTPPQYIVNSTYPSASMFPDIALSIAQISQIQSILQSNSHGYKLFYSVVANAEGGGGASGGATTSQFTVNPPSCSDPTNVSCKDKALSSTLTIGGVTNTNGDMEFDLQRLGVYDTTNPSFVTASSGLRQYIAWEWSATAGISADLIGLDTTNNQYPSYDIDGRLKEVTIYSISMDSTGEPTVSYEDLQGGDIDSTWDSNSCGPKPGLQSDSEIFTITQNGTYLQIKEGKIYNPETGQVVRSVNQRDSIDVIQRAIQLSNNTGRFCSGGAPVNPIGGTNDPNPVEVCVDSSSGQSNNCFNGANIAATCYDTNPGVNTIYVRSRLEDRRGNSWMTNASGQLKVQ